MKAGGLGCLLVSETLIFIANPHWNWVRFIFLGSLFYCGKKKRFGEEQGLWWRTTARALGTGIQAEGCQTRRPGLSASGPPSYLSAGEGVCVGLPGLTHSPAGPLSGGRGSWACRGTGARAGAGTGVV